MVDRLLLGLDVGTSGAKALLIDEAGNVVAEATNSYPMSTPRPLWAEQDPEDWWRAAVASLRQVLAGIEPSRVAAVGLTGQMHGLILLDRNGRVLRPCIMWNDQRTGAQCAEIADRLGAERVLDLIGNPVLPGFTAPKLLWIQEHEPEVYRRAAHALLPKDYVRYRLTGAFATEVSDASGTALFDVRQRRWSKDLLDALEIDASWLPEVFESIVPSAAVSPAAVAETGLVAGTPVVGGGGDQAAQAVGTGIVREGLVSATIGTSGVVFAASDAYRAEPGGLLHAFAHAIPGQWHLMGVMLSAAGSLRWFRDALGQSEVAEAQAKGVDAYALLDAQAATAPAGCEGLIFLPYLTGERAPHPDPNARGVFFGLTLRHGKPDLIRSVLEGVAYGLRDSLELMRGLGLKVDEVRVSGGGAQSALWRRILADVFDSEIARVNVTQGAAYGAALLAGVGAGVYASVPEASDATIRVIDCLEPGPDAATYADYYPLYRSLYPALASSFQEISQRAARQEG